VIVPFVLAAACNQVPQPEKETMAAVEPADRSIESYRRELLELAFDGVSKMPLNPHVKNRSRAQQQVVNACLELGQARMAESFLEEIQNWQYWLGCANLAYYYARHGNTEKAEWLVHKTAPALKAAEDRSKGRIIASTPNERLDSLQDWRYESVLTRIAEVQLLLHDEFQVHALEDTHGELNAAVLNAKMALRREKDEKTLDLLRVFTNDPSFEVVHVGLLRLAEYAGAHYEKMNLPDFLQQDVFPKIEKMPVFMRIDVLDKFASVALENQDSATAMSLMDQMDELVDGLVSRPQFQIPEAVKLVRLRYDAGQAEMAGDRLDALWISYNGGRENIADIYRAQLICRMAEAYAYLGDTATALELYAMAVDEGQVNPNARPQADDLSGICCSMALSAVEPTPALRNSLENMNRKLDVPW
jgi:hypothetical protein